MEPCRIGYGSLVPQNLAKMWREGLLTDVRLVVQDRTFSVHKVTLAASSPYFQGLFMSQMTESRAESLELHDIDTDVLEEILSFMYTGEARLTGFEFAARLLAAADRFLMIDFVQIIMQFIKEQATDENLTELLFLGHKFHINDLEAFAFSRCCERFTVLTSSAEQIGFLPRDLFLKVLRSEFLVIEKEEEVLNAVLVWLDAQSADAAEPFAASDQISEVLHAVRFSCICPLSFRTFWPRLAAYCNDLPMAHRILNGLGGRSPGVDPEANRWILRHGNEDDLAQEVYEFATSHFEYGLLGVSLVKSRPPSATSTLKSTVINLMQRDFNQFEAAIEERSGEVRTEGYWAVIPWAGLFFGLISAKMLPLKIVNSSVVPLIKKQDHETPRLLLCDLAHCLARLREQPCGARDSAWDAALSATTRKIGLALNEQMQKAQSPWLQVRLQRAIEQVRCDRELARASLDTHIVYTQDLAQI